MKKKKKKMINEALAQYQTIKLWICPNRKYFQPTCVYENINNVAGKGEMLVISIFFPFSNVLKSLFSFAFNSILVTS